MSDWDGIPDAPLYRDTDGQMKPADKLSHEGFVANSSASVVEPAPPWRREDHAHLSPEDQVEAYAIAMLVGRAAANDQTLEAFRAFAASVGIVCRPYFAPVRTERGYEMTLFLNPND